MMKDFGIFYKNIFEDLSTVVKKEGWKDILNFVLSLVLGFEGIQGQNDSSTGRKAPPVLPSELVKLRSFEFNEIVAKQEKRYCTLYTTNDLEIVQQQHRDLLSAYRSEDCLYDAITNFTNMLSFTDGWRCAGSGRFQHLKEFCGGLATVFSSTATVESDFSIINCEKNSRRSALTDLSLEGILHLTQFDMVKNFKEG